VDLHLTQEPDLLRHPLRRQLDRAPNSHQPGGEGPGRL
jgi:hypothetical protein